MGNYEKQITIHRVQNGFIVQRGDKAYIAFMESEVISLVKKLIAPEELPDPPF